MFFSFLRMKLQMRPELKVFLVICKLCPLVLYRCIRAIILFFVPRRYRGKKSIKGQTVLITGAGRGIGRELAIEFSKHSTYLVLVDLCKDSLFETEKLLDGCSKAFLYKCDVSEREEVYEVAKAINDRVGKVDILVNNAGIVSGKGLIDLSDEEILKTIEVNMLAHFWMLKAFLPDMMKTNMGHIVSIASLAGLTGLPSLTDYCASKFGAVGLMESLQLELEGKELHGVKTTLVCPNLVSTGLFEGTGTALSAFLKPEFVAREIMESVLEDKDFVAIPKWSKLFIILKLTMPTPAVRDFYKYVGLRDFMTSFRGRTNQNIDEITPHRTSTSNGCITADKENTHI